jgi:hypothetical protein
MLGAHTLTGAASQYEMIACNFLFNFIPKELFYMKITVKNTSLNLALLYHAGHGLRQHVADTAAMQCTDLVAEGLKLATIWCIHS